MARKQGTSSDLTGRDVVRNFLSLPAVGQQVMLEGLQHELRHGDRQVAEELLGFLQSDERSRAAMAALQRNPEKLTPAETQMITDKLDDARAPKLPKSKARRRW